MGQSFSKAAVAFDLVYMKTVAIMHTLQGWVLSSCTLSPTCPFVLCLKQTLPNTPSAELAREESGSIFESVLSACWEKRCISSGSLYNQQILSLESSKNVFLLLLFTKQWPWRSCHLENKFSFMQSDMRDLFESINCRPEKGCLNELIFSNSLSTLFLISWIHTPVIFVASAL